MPHHPTEAGTWTGRDDGPGTRRIHQCISVNTETEPREGFALIGFACDEGVRRNQGRIGAAAGPGALRAQLGGLPWAEDLPIHDCGDIYCEDQRLDASQAELGKLLAKRIQAGQETLVLGGGHETAWGHYQGLAKAWPGRIGIINFDAHFDLREPMHGKGSSGTPFFQIAHSCRSSGRDFDYCCLGIQPSGNARILFKRARDLGVEAILASDLKWGQQGQLMQRIERFIEAVDAVYLSIDLDVFSEAHAPGVSAPQALGLDPWDLLPYLDRIAERAPKASLDIVELNPSSDQDEQTARLGAQLAHRWLLKRARALTKS